jgi:hypothetical protein
MMMMTLDADGPPNEKTYVITPPPLPLLALRGESA